MIKTLQDVKNIFEQLSDYALTPEDALFIVKTSGGLDREKIKKSCQNFIKYTLPMLGNAEKIKKAFCVEKSK